ncbi:MAG: ATP-binding protein [Bacteroidia bacterium]
MDQESLQVGKPVTGKDFIGREEEIRLMMQLLAQGQSIVLIAPRRYGKTSLVNEVLRRLENKGFYTVYVDIFSNPTMEGLASDITKQVLANKRLDKAFSNFVKSVKDVAKNIQFRTELHDFEFMLGFNERHRDENLLLDESIGFIELFSKKNNKRMVAAFDEFGDLKKYGSEKTVKLFRSRIQTHKNASYIFSGSYESVMNELFVTPRSPFYRFARIIQLRGISKEIFAQHISEKLNSNKQKITNDALNEVYDFTNGHPYYTQLMLQQMVLFYQKSKEIGKHEIGAIKNDLLTIEINYIEKTWEELSKTKESIPVLLALVEKREPVYAATAKHPGNTARALRKLIHNGTLYKDGSTYRFNDPLLLLWIEKNIIK